MFEAVVEVAGEGTFDAAAGFLEWSFRPRGVAGSRRRFRVVVDALQGDHVERPANDRDGRGRGPVRAA